MPQNDSDPFEVLRKLSETYRHIRLGRGVVGKTGHVTLALFAIWAIILLRLSGSWLDLALLAGGIATTTVYYWWVGKTHDFAEKNPGLALLEGAELIEYQRFEAQAKGLLSARSAPVIEGPTHQEGEHE